MKIKLIILFLILFISAAIVSFIFYQVSQPAENKLLGTEYTPSAVTPIISTSPITLDKIFSSDHSWANNLPKEKTVILIATGDVIPARSVNSQATRFNNFRWPYEKTGDVLKTADLTIINLESPLIPNCPVVNDGMIFCGDEKNIEGLTFTGVDVATLENNHIDNYGNIGVENTIRLLNSSGIKAVRENNPQVIDLKGQKFAFLAYHDLVNPQINTVSTVEDKVAQDIKQAKGSANIVIVAFHWGTEYTEQPGERQQMLAHMAIDNGADLILGNHPHWIEPAEIYKNKLIVYAHGNFIFDQMWSEKTKQGIIGRFTFYEDKLIDAEFLPIYIKDYGQPYFLDGDEKALILAEMKAISIRLATNAIQ